MRIGASMLQQNNFANINQAKTNVFQNNSKSVEHGKQNNKDSSNISSRGKALSAIETLMKQKQSITEQKNKLIASTLEDGGSMDTISLQLENFEEKLDNLDSQIAQATLEEAQRAEKEEKSNPPKNEEQAQYEALANVTELATSLDRTEMISTIKNKVDSYARILEAEIKMDKLTGGSSVGTQKVIEGKEADIAELNQKSNELVNHISDALIDTIESVSENTNQPMVVPNENDADDKLKDKEDAEDKAEDKKDESTDEKAESV